MSTSPNARAKTAAKTERRNVKFGRKRFTARKGSAPTLRQLSPEGRESTSGDYLADLSYGKWARENDEVGRDVKSEKKKLVSPKRKPKRSPVKDNWVYLQEESVRVHSASPCCSPTPAVFHGEQVDEEESGIVQKEDYSGIQTSQFVTENESSVSGPPKAKELEGTATDTRGENSPHAEIPWTDGDDRIGENANRYEDRRVSNYAERQPFRATRSLDYSSDIKAISLLEPPSAARPIENPGDLSDSSSPDHPSDVTCDNSLGNVKPAWELGKMFKLNKDFPMDILKDQAKPSGINERMESSRKIPEWMTERHYVNLSLNLRPLSPSVKTCRITLPTHFPGVVTKQAHKKDQPESDSESSADDFDFTSLQDVERYEEMQKEKSHLLEVPDVGRINLVSSNSSSPRSCRSECSTPAELLAMTAASSEYLAARVVTELKTSLLEPEDDHQGYECVTPTNIRRRRHSMFATYSPIPPRSKSATVDVPLALPLLTHGIDKAKSLPDLENDRLFESRRMFVSFRENSPHVDTVNLRGKGEVAARCRRINRLIGRREDRQTRLDLGLEPKVKKKVRVRRWVKECHQTLSSA
ncbi:uncharacterized protein LOC125561225 [Nematostella vectensis]|uniref:uncharacterized protein LOC125561225 n=1 Tax=Nematostella vectensis TaxID=45351 RepID=UPI002076ED0B|nr:uncharacterized protein LOC125561225 [Nematostella vectensis]